MSKSLTKFLLRLILLALVVVVIGYVLFTGILEAYYLPVFPFLFLILLLITAMVHVVLLRAIEKMPGKFIRQFMTASGIKVIVYLLIIIVYLLIRRENATSFLLTFLAFYLIFTTFEVLSILDSVREK